MTTEQQDILEGEILDLKDTIDELRSEIKDLEDEKDQLESEKDDLEDTNSELIKENDELRDLVDEGENIEVTDIVNWFVSAHTHNYDKLQILEQFKHLL